MVTVYYGCIAPIGTGSIRHDYCYEPEPVVKTVYTDIGFDNSVDDKPDLLKCPAFQQSIKNIFKIKATHDYDFTWDSNNVSSKSYDQNYFNKNIIIRDANIGFLSLVTPKIFLFSDAEKLDIEVLPAIYEKKAIYEGITITGEYDIANHLRALEWSFVLSKPQTVTIKTGDPLYYIKFKTDEKINFKRFYVTPQLEELQIALLRCREHTNKIIPLSWYYNIVKKYYKKTYLKNINQNLLD